MSSTWKLTTCLSGPETFQYSRDLKAGGRARHWLGFLGLLQNGSLPSPVCSLGWGLRPGCAYLGKVGSPHPRPGLPHLSVLGQSGLPTFIPVHKRASFPSAGDFLLSALMSRLGLSLWGSRAKPLASDCGQGFRWVAARCKSNREAGWLPSRNESLGPQMTHTVRGSLAVGLTLPSAA